VLRNLLVGLFLCCLMALSGCFMQPVALPELHKYQLNSCGPMFMTFGKSQKVLKVSLPQAFPPYNDTRMVYSQRSNEISYFSENRWVISPNRMLLPLMVQFIRNTHYFRAVVGFPSNADADYQLDTSLIVLKQEFCGQKSHVHVVLDVVLMNAQTRKVLATRRIDVCQPTRCPTPASGVAAYQCAIDKALGQLMQFLSVAKSYE
jgi:cholesterol transport system auxiliary component